jgi:acetate kinase
MTRVATLNAGTSTLKVAIVEVDASRSVVRTRRVQDFDPEGDREAGCREALGSLGEEAATIDAVGHRLVHGGSEFRDPVRLDASVEARLEALVPLAPLHLPPALDCVRAARRAFPALPQVAVFDTAFHARRSEASRRYALPPEVADALGLWRYGFHGIAHASLVESLAAAEGIEAHAANAVSLQLGAGCSACAVEDGVSIETSMGFTPLEGLVMATRSGDLDPAIVLHLLRHGYAPDEVEVLLTRRSGLLGLAGSADLRVVLAAEAGGDSRAALAVALFVRRIVATVGAYLTLLRGHGAVVFGGGIGSHSAEIRRRVAEGLTAWDVELDAQRNASGEPGRISTPGSRAVWVFRTDEESLIARAAARALEESR